MSGPSSDIDTLEQAKQVLYTPERKSHDDHSESEIDGLSHKQVVQMLKLLVNEINGSHSKGSVLKQMQDDAKNMKTEFNKIVASHQKEKEELKKKYEDEKEELKNQVNEIKQTVERTTKGMKTAEKRAGIPAGQALSVEERDQLDFFLQSPGIGMIFLSIAFAVSGEDVSGTLENFVQNYGIMKMAGEAGKEFPGADEVGKEFDGDYEKAHQQVKDEGMDLQKKFDDAVREVFTAADADLEVVARVVKDQVQAKSTFFRKTVVPTIVSELTEFFSLNSKLLPDDAKRLMHFKAFLVSGGFDKFQSDILSKISEVFENRIMQRAGMQLPVGKTEDKNKATDECIDVLKRAAKNVIINLGEQVRSELWKNVLECMAIKSQQNQPDLTSKTSADNSKKQAEAAKISISAESAYGKAIQKLAGNLSTQIEPILVEISTSDCLKEVWNKEYFSIGEFLSGLIITYALDQLGRVLKSQLQAMFTEEIKEAAKQHRGLNLFLDIVTKSKDSYQIQFWRWWHRNWIKKPSEETTKRHGFMHGVKNTITVILPIFVLVVQFAYLFFVWHELYEIYDGGFCPGYSGRHRQDPPYGADTKIRTLVGFVGAYFVMKNGSKLFKYLKALEGNNLTRTSSFVKLLPFSTIFLNCPYMQQIEDVMSQCFRKLIENSDIKNVVKNSFQLIKDWKSDVPVPPSKEVGLKQSDVPLPPSSLPVGTSSAGYPPGKDREYSSFLTGSIVFPADLEGRERQLLHFLLAKELSTLSI